MQQCRFRLLQVPNIYRRRLFSACMKNTSLGGERRDCIMSKFNQENTNKTKNRDGYPAYSMNDKEYLVTAALTTMFGEQKYYGSTDEEIVKLAAECAKKDPEFLHKLACYARREGNMRSVSHVLTAVIAHEAAEYTRQTIRSVVIRPDDITEIMACYKAMYGKPFPNAMKREVASVLQNFDEYQIAKYNGGSNEIKFRDVLHITHPVPKNEETEKLFGRILDDELATPYTWETELSERGNTKEVWDELIASGKVGYMALLRNLRNIVKSGADIAPVLEVLSDPDRVKKSRQLPFRFFSAYRTLEQEGLMRQNIYTALENALCASVDNMEKIDGRTLIAVDVSGSMSQPVSKKSSVRCCDIATLLGAIAGRLCDDAAVCFFSCKSSWLAKDPGYRVEHYGKYDSILDICLKNSFSGGGTDMSLPMHFALNVDKGKFIRPFDRVIYFSDNVCNSVYYGIKNPSVQGFVDTYRRKYNKNFWVHGVDLQGYGTQQFCGKEFNLIAGWSESVLPFINLAEKGMGSLVETIAAYSV